MIDQGAFQDDFIPNSGEISQETDKSSEVKLRPKGVKVIYGEKAVFRSLSKAIQDAKELVCTTRLSTHPLDLRKKHLEEFANSLRAVHTRNDPISESLKRIIVVNSHDKRSGVDDLLNIKGKLFLYLMTPTDAYNFEIVIIDNKKAFVLYRNIDINTDELCSYAFCCENEAYVQKEILLFSRLTKQAEDQEKVGEAMIIEKNDDVVKITTKGAETKGTKITAMEAVKVFFDETMRKQPKTPSPNGSGIKYGE
jgi:hypothetical protein